MKFVFSYLETEDDPLQRPGCRVHPKVPPLLEWMEDTIDRPDLLTTGDGFPPCPILPETYDR
jgi:hypothetical protein